ncbi:MAG: M20/M25/M40 family metallo-hydrolase [Candidatus Thorarchaeota archaeon]|jgi:acetylornithine deacetylase/succinyl-diaminopimelate desuccinylase-like protein
MSGIEFSELLIKAAKYESKFLKLLGELVSFPTVAYREPKAIQECADHLEGTLESLGYKVTQYPVREDGHPVVYAEKKADSDKTLLCYHHYDVQPEDPLDDWVSSPWKLTEREGRIYARGTSDDKGETVQSMLGVLLLEDILGYLPLNVKFVIEGEEEAGSDNLPKFTEKNTELLRADGCVWEGACLYPSDDDDEFTIPNPVEIMCGVKGNAYYELYAGGVPNFPRIDVHSGSAAAVPNAAWRVVWALSTLKDENEKVLIDGFYDSVIPPLEEDIAALDEIGDENEKFYKENYGLSRLLLDRRGVELSEELHLRPSLSICGMGTGYQDEGGKTIVPSEAMAKLDIRLVPDQTPEEVTKMLTSHLEKKGFGDIELKFLTGYKPAKTPITDPFIQAVRNATNEIISPMPTHIIPIVPGSGPAYLFAPYTPFSMISNTVIGTDIHAPNENMPKNGIVPSIAYNALIAHLVSKLP